MLSEALNGFGFNACDLASMERTGHVIVFFQLGRRR